MSRARSAREIGCFSRTRLSAIWRLISREVPRRAMRNEEGWIRRMSGTDASPGASVTSYYFGLNGLRSEGLGAAPVDSQGGSRAANQRVTNLFLNDIHGEALRRISVAFPSRP